MAISDVNLLCLSDPHDLHDMAVHPRARLQDAKKYPHFKYKHRKHQKQRPYSRHWCILVSKAEGRPTPSEWNRPDGPRDQVSVNLTYRERSLAVTVSTPYKCLSRLPDKWWLVLAETR